MPQVPFVGSSYRVRSIAFSAQRAINMYPVKAEKESKSVAGLQGTPGLKTFIEFPLFPGRGGWNVNGRVFMVYGNTLYEVFVDKTYVSRGMLDTSTGNVSISDNGQQLIVVDGPNGYVLTLATNVFTNITGVSGFLGADTVTFIGGYFMLNKPDSGIYYISGLYDGLTYDPLDFATAEGSPDNLVAVRAVHNQAWLLGDSTVEVVYNQGGADFPFANIQGAFIQYGCIAPFSVANTANTIFWLGQDNDGGGVVWMATGYQPQRISTFAIEYYLQQYNSSLSQSIGYTYQEDGHYFYCLTIPGAPTSLAYDIGMDEWHERASFFEGQYSRPRPQFHVYAYGLHLVGDYENGKLYMQSLDYFDDDGQEIRRERITPYLTSPNLEYIYFSRFQIDMETGVGLDGGNPDEDTNPKIMLQWSDDGGHKWSNEYWVSVGKIGNYMTRALWRRLGRARFRIWKVAYTARTKFFLIAGYADTEAGIN